MKANLVVGIVAALVLIGCKKESEPTDNWNGEIRLSSILPQAPTNSDVSDMQIADGQKIGVFILEDNDDEDAPENYITRNLKYALKPNFMNVRQPLTN